MRQEYMAALSQMDPKLHSPASESQSHNCVDRGLPSIPSPEDTTILTYKRVAGSLHSNNLCIDSVSSHTGDGKTNQCFQ